MAITVAPTAFARAHASGASDIRQITFTTTAADDETVTTDFGIGGTLLRYSASGGDGAWDFALNDGNADIFTVTGINTAAPESGPIFEAGTNSDFNIPVAGTLKITIANKATGVGVIVITYRAD